MNFLRHSPSSHIRRFRRHHQVRTLYDAVSTLKCPRDRGLDHAVERERRLKPLLNLKNLIIAEPSKSIPLTLISQSKENLDIPFRPIEFIRKYPSAFQEFHPGSLNIQPHIRLTPEVITLNSEENLLYQSVDYKQDIARRLLKLLMIGKINKIPVFLLERLKWELGLPQNYEQDLIPEFPDYFRVINGNNLGEDGKTLELVCWSDEFAVSEMENKGAKDGKTQFCLQYSKEFEMEKKYKKWVDGWQKLPYISPYESALHLPAKTDESDKWAVSVLHELLNLFVGKKAERDTLLYLGEYLGLRSRFKLAFLQHPGIFYVSSKIGTHTVVLRDGYKRGMLILRHSLMDMRFKYAQLMNVIKDDEKVKSTEKKSDRNDVKGSKGKEPEGNEEDNDETCDSSDEDEDEDEDEDDDDDEGVEGENVSKIESFKGKGEDSEENTSRRNSMKSNGRTGGKKNYVERFEGENVNKRGSFTRKGAEFEEKSSRRNVSRTTGKTYDKDDYKEGFNGENASKRGRFKKNNADFEEKDYKRSASRTNGRTYEKDNYKERFEGENGSKRGGFKRNSADFEEKNDRRNSSRTNGRTYGKGNNNEGFKGDNADKSGRFREKGADFEERKSTRNVTRRTSGRNDEENAYRSSTKFSGRKNVRGGDSNIPILRTQKSDFSRTDTGI